MANKKFPKYEVLLIAGIDSLGLARFPHLLHSAGCRVTLLAPPGLAIIKSRYVSHHIPTAYDPQARAMHLKELVQLQQQSFTTIIVGDEATLTALMEYRGEEWLDPWFPVNHRSKASYLILSKLAFQQAAIDEGLRMPISSLCQGWTEVEAAVNNSGYPVILKAAQSLSGSGVRKVHNFKELELAYDQLASSGQELLVQHFYDGPIGSTDVLFNHGEPICWQSAYALRCWPTPLSSSSARQLMDHPDIEFINKGVGKITGFNGFAGIDWIHDLKSDQIYLLEINPRPTPSLRLDRFSGISFSQSLNQLLSGNPKISQPKPKQLLTSSPLGLFPQMLYWAIDEHSWQSFAICCWNDAPWHDPQLLIAYLRRVASHYIPLTWRQKLKQWLRGTAITTQQNLELELHLRKAINHHELCIYYQPQIDIKTNKIIGAEALIRWNNPLGELMLPLDFIPLAEKSNLILNIGEWVLKETCRQGQQWLNEGLPSLNLSVNLSSYQLQQSKLNLLIADILAETGFPANNLELDLTESSLLGPRQNPIEILSSLRSLGVRLAIDDFGVRYSSLSYVERFPVDILKIDKVFIKNIPEDIECAEIVANILSIGNQLGLKVLAEGVETQKQLDFLSAQGCYAYQGYLKSKPLPAEQFVNLLRSQY